MFFIYALAIIAEQFYLEEVYNMHFNLSDPTNYYVQIKTFDLNGLIEFINLSTDRSNSIYFVINWIYNSGFGDPSIYGVVLKITNVTLLLSAFSIITRKYSEKIGILELILLMHPWLIFLIIRNVRDTHIIFALSIFFYFCSKPNLKPVDIIYLSFSIYLMYLLRPLFVPLMLLITTISFYKLNRQGTKIITLVSVVLFAFFALFPNIDDLRIKFASSFLGNSIYFGSTTEEDISQMFDSVIYNQTFTTEFISLFFNKIAVAIPVFLFTPHPYNWMVKFLQLSDNGIYVIYTNVDMWLITFGAIFNYIYTIPLLFKFIHRFKYIDYGLALIPLYMASIYIVFLLGNADLRIRYTFIYFLVLVFYKSGLTLYKDRGDRKYFYISMLTLFLIPFISN